MPSTDASDSARGSGDIPDDDLTDFLGLLNELKATGCSLLVVGDAPRRLFTRASERMFGADDELRYRVLAVTDATPESVADRLPDPLESPRPITETTHVLNHAGAIRSITAATSPSTPPKLAGVRETRIADPQLEGLQSALTDAISEFGGQRGRGSADVRVGVDSLEPLLDFYGESVVRECLRLVGSQARQYEAMAHFLLQEPYESDTVQTLADDVDAIVEIRLDDSAADRTGEQRWHVPGRDLKTGWAPL